MSVAVDGPDGSREEHLRSTALHEAMNFWTLRREVPRLADLADTVARLEHYLRVGSMPLEAEWLS